MSLDDSLGINEVSEPLEGLVLVLRAPDPLTAPNEPGCCLSSQSDLRQSLEEIFVLCFELWPCGRDSLRLSLSGFNSEPCAVCVVRAGWRCQLGEKLGPEV